MRHTCRVSTVVAISVSSQSKTITVSPSTGPSLAPALATGSALTGDAGGELGGVSGATLLALVFVPSGFLLLHRLGMRCPLKQQPDQQQQQQQPAAAGV